MTIAGGLGIMGGPGNAMRFSGVSRGRIQGSPVQGVNYPSPFFDVAHTYLPVTVKQMFRWCRYYFLTNPLINATVFKLSEYPITDIIFDHEDAGTRKTYAEFFQDRLRYRSFMIEVGLDYFTYGNAFVSVGYPLQKYLSCKACGHTELASKCRTNWTFTNYQFRLHCPRCGMTGDATVKDITVKNASGIKLIRWNPEDIEIVYNDLTGNYTYFYTIPAVIRNDIVIGRKEIVEDVPQIFIQALKEQKGITFSADKLFHLRRPTLATQDRGWGIPLLLAVLKDTFYLQIMKKAQEAILLEHIVPLRVLFPQPASGTADPFTSINLADWRDHVAFEIARWRLDPNYIPIMPLPLGTQTIGGDGKALLMTGEIQQWSEQIIIGMGVPREFLFGGMSYAGTNVSMRMLENAFLGYVQRHKGLLAFVMQEVQSCLGWPKVTARFKPFKMADDLQRKAYLFQLNQAQKISDTTLLSDADLDADEENKRMIAETEDRIDAMKKQQVAMAEVQGEASLVMAKYQAKAQQLTQAAMMAPPAPGEPGAAEQPGAPGAGGTPGGQDAAAPAEMPPGAVPAQDASQAVPGALPPPSPDQQFDELVQSGIGNKNRMQQGQGAIDLPTMALMQAKQIAAMPPQQQPVALQNVMAMSPELGDLVKQYLAQLGVKLTNGAGGQTPSVDMRPLPEQRSPRRATGIV